MKPGTWILCFYPHGWRQRYEEEMLALLEQHTVTLATIFDLLLGALDARLDPTYRAEKALLLFKDKRSIATTFLCSYAIFLFAMYNWHHYIPLSLSLTPFYLDMDMLSLRTSLFSGSFSPNLSSDALLTGSDLLLQLTLLVSNLFFIVLLIKQAKGTRLKRFVRPAILCFVLLMTLPLIPVLGISASTVALTNPSGTLLSVQIRPFNQIVELYVWSFRLLCPLLPLLISSLFIAMVNIRNVWTAARKHWLFLAMLFYLVLPLGRMLWLNNSVQIPSAYVPFPSVVLGTILTYFPPFAGLATLVLGLANSEGSKRMWQIALFPACLLSVVMVAKLVMTLITLPLIWRSLLHPLSPGNDSFSLFTLTTMLLVMFLAGGIALIALMRGFVALKAVES